MQNTRSFEWCCGPATGTENGWFSVLVRAHDFVNFWFRPCLGLVFRVGFHCSFVALYFQVVMDAKGSWPGLFRGIGCK